MSRAGLVLATTGVLVFSSACNDLPQGGTGGNQEQEQDDNGDDERDDD